MALRSFKGGVHPYEGKELSKDKPVVRLEPSSELVFPLSQHIGAPAKAVVNVGDTVLRGQVLAEANGFVSAPVISSVSGTVKAIEKRRSCTGSMVESIVISNDNMDSCVSFNEISFEEALKLDRETIIKKISDAGIVGMGGAGFPTHVKLSPKDPDKIEYIIVNCAECEPYLTSDYRTMLEKTDKLYLGLKLLVSLFKNAKGVFAIEDNKRDCISLLSEKCVDDNISVCPLLTKYPQGGERQLIHAVTGRDINSKMLPADAGCIVDNVSTVCAIYDAVVLGKPLMDRFFTVSGDNVVNPQNYEIRIGMSFRDILEASGGEIDKAQKWISGGPMMGFSMFDLDVPTTKTTGAFLSFKEDEASIYDATACINCGRCVNACPENLVPSRLSKFFENKVKDEFEKWYGLECIECGSCTYVCPAKRPLAQEIKTFKHQILAEKKKQKEIGRGN
ncbi:MAG: electron transport complex subunit RsxC [Lachnospiraceae bacterium]|nr:electron transport complex subunit RsxC [Lachnospiraceae bacterium]